MNTPFDLLAVTIKGEQIHARPIEWDSEPVNGQAVNADGNEIKPTKYATTCPHCANLITFSLDVLRNTNIACPTCGAGKQKTVAEQINKTTESTLEIVKNYTKTVQTKKQSPFVDPIDSGRIDTTNHAE